jgi:ribosomal-protein-alanine N-acetyltransferase
VRIGLASGVALSIDSAFTWYFADILARAEPYSSAFIPAWNSGVRLATFLTVAILIHVLRNMYERESRVARIDYLTGAANARSFYESVEKQAALLARHPRPFAVLYLDVDNLKQLNDGRGHAAGEKMLQATVATLKRTLRPSDTVARLGGDEFAVLLTDMDARPAKKPRQAVPGDLQHGRPGLRVPAEVGRRPCRTSRQPHVRGEAERQGCHKAFLVLRCPPAGAGIHLDIIQRRKNRPGAYKPAAKTGCCNAARIHGGARMKSIGKGFLTAAGAASGLIALMHIGIILIGQPAYRFFTGLGDDLADLRAAGSMLPDASTAAIACCFAAFALYGFSGARIIPPSPRLRAGLAAIGSLYLLRGLMNAPFYVLVLLQRADLERYNSIFYDSISLGIGLLYLAGAKLEWKALDGSCTRKSPVQNRGDASPAPDGPKRRRPTGRGKESTVELALKTCTVRSYRAEDAESLASYADNRKVWQNLRDGFPHPYTVDHAKAFIQRALRSSPETMFAIRVDGAAAGGIGFTLHTDVERISAEIGYWLGEPFWGRGIMTEALKAVTRYAVERHGLHRVYAVPYEPNKASHRVLEKAGYTLEGRMRKSAIKDGRIIDQFMYAFVV